MSKGKQITKELAAALLLDSAFTTDEIACKKYGVSIDTLQRYRRKLAEGDEELLSLAATKKAAFDAAWAESLHVTLGKSIRVIGECAEAVSLDPAYKKNPMVIQALAGAMKLCADVYLTSKVIDARLKEHDNAGHADADRTPDGLLGQIPAEAPAN